jgi:mannose-binding lectin 1
VRHSNDNFRVDVDGQLCFDSTKIKLPLGYTFGISAASAETPDTFEVFKFVTTTENYSPDLQEPIQQDARVAYSQGQYKQAINEEQPPNSGLFDDIPEVPAADIRSTEAQFADLHNRLQAMMKNLNAANRDVAIFQRSTRDDLTKLAVQLSRIEGVLSKFDSVDKKLDDVNSDVRQTKKDLHQALEKQVAGLKHVVKDTHSTILGTLAASAPSLLMYAVMVFGSNAVLIVAYLIYKQRKANSPKKYL